MKDMVERNKILEIVTGSFLYGTNIETSDKDFNGIFIADKEYYLGLEIVKEVDLSFKSKDDDGKNNSDAIDRKFYEFRKFVKICSDGNPNIQEFIFVDPIRNKDIIVSINEIGKDLLANKDMFVSQLCRQRYLGYGISQLHKAKIKPDNHSELSEFKTTFEQNILRSAFSFRLIEFKHINSPLSSLISFHSDFASIGGLNFNLNVKISDVYNSVCERLKKASHRSEGWTKYGLDLKFCSHCIRLMLEGKELLETGKIEFPLKDRELLLDIRNGKKTLTEMNELMESTKNDLEVIKTDLPKVPDYNKINKFLIETVEKSFRKG